MKTAIWASYYHNTSTNEAPHHDLCPPGTHSWCFAQRAIAAGKAVPDHSQNMTTYLNPVVAANIYSVYQKVTADDLLKRCLQGKTQKANECLHSTVCNKCPKHVYASRRRVEISCALAVGQFNRGASATREFFFSLGAKLSARSLVLGAKRDLKRTSNAEIAIHAKTKKRREQRKAAQQKWEAEQEEREDGPSYCAGAF